MVNVINIKAAEHQDVAGSWFVCCRELLVVKNVIKTRDTYYYYKEQR